MQKSLIVILLILVVLLVFALFNQTIVPINLGVVRYEVVLPVVIGCALLIGMGIQALMSVKGNFNKRAEINELRKQNAKLSQELIDLKKTQVEPTPVTPDTESLVDETHL
ncbi:LapA family protein [Guggenheimella bovis]